MGLQKAELNYVQQDGRNSLIWNPEFTYSHYNQLHRVTSVQPIISISGKNAKFYINLSEDSYALNEKTESNLGDATPNTTNDQHDIPIDKKFDWGLCGGPGLRTGVGYFLLEGRYYYAFGRHVQQQEGKIFSKSSAGGK